MAKTNDKMDIDDDLLDGINHRRGRRSFKVPIILFAIFVALVLVFTFDVLNIRRNYLNPVMRNVPIIRNLVQQDEDGDIELTREEMVLRIRQLEYQLSVLEEGHDELVARYNDRGQEISRLAEYRDGLEQFNRDKEAFDMMVASQDPRSFVEFYRNIYPENADRIYAQFLAANLVDREMRQFLNTFSAMEEDRAAVILEEMMGTEIDLVVDILSGINTDTSAEILGAMRTENAAVLARRMAPENW
jgi:hypothetical protein